MRKNNPLNHDLYMRFFEIKCIFAAAKNTNKALELDNLINRD